MKKILYTIVFICLFSCHTIIYDSENPELLLDEGLVVLNIHINEPGWEVVIFNSDNGKLAGVIKSIYPPSQVNILQLKEGRYTIKYLKFRDVDITKEPMQWNINSESFLVKAGTVNYAKELDIHLSSTTESDDFLVYEYREMGPNTLEKVKTLYPELF